MGTDYDVFISYARRDNEPDSSGRGWVTAIKEVIEDDARRYQGREYRVFLDTSHIRGMQDWRARILGALRTSKVMLVCLSPNYLSSQPCRWEWEEYLQRQARVMASAGAGDDDDGTVASVFFVEMPDGSSDAVRRWREQVTRGDGVDLRPWFPDGAHALSRAEVRSRVEQLGADIWQRLERARRAESSVGNLMRYNPYFVGRTEELDRLNHAVLAPGSIGVVTTVHGLGGLGKTELTVQYAHAYRGRFAAGVWLLHAEGQREMLPLLATLADEPRFDFSASEAAREDPAQRGREVLAELRRRSGEVAAATLLILDNVSEPGLLAEPQVAALPNRTDLILIATTRLGEADFVGGRGTLGFLHLGELDDEAALTLIRDHQPMRADGMPGFASDGQEQAARDIVAALAGFTLAVEQVAIYLGRRPDVAPTDVLRGLTEHGLTAPDRVVASDSGVAESIRHQDRTLSAVLQTTLADFDAPTRSALLLASLMPPDSVPWPWLRRLLAARGALAPTGPFETTDGSWQRIRRMLTGRRLLTAGAQPDLARMHRLIGAHLAPAAGADDCEQVDQDLVGRAKAINAGGEADPWEYSVLVDALIPRAANQQDLALRLNLDSEFRSLSDRLLQHIGDARPLELAGSILNVVEQIAAARPANLDAQRDLSVALRNVARMKQGTDPSASLALCRRALHIVEQIAAALPGNLDAQRDVFVASNLVARMQQGTDPAGALDLYNGALDIAIQVAAARPRSLSALRDLSVAAENAGDAHERGYEGVALGLHLQQLHIAEEIARTRPGAFDASSDVATAREKIARSWERSGRGEDALDMFRKVQADRERLAAAQPGNLDAQRELSIALSHVARMREEAAPKESMDSYNRSLHIAEQVAANRPGNLDAQRELAICLHNVARLLGDTDHAAALSLFQRSLGIVESITERQPGNLDAQRDLSACLTSVARLVEDSDADAAMMMHQRCWQLDEQGARARLGDLVDRRRLVFSTDKRTTHRAPAQAPPHFQLRTGRLSNFIGRSDVLLRLYVEALVKDARWDSGALVTRRKIALVGMGGMGKTAIAMKFAEDFAHAFPGGVVWLDAGGDDVRNEVTGRVDRDLVLGKVAAQVQRWTHETATRLGLPLQPARDARTAENALHTAMGRAKAIAEHLEGTVLWILDDVPAGMSEYLDGMACPAHSSVTLITARDKLLEGGFTTIPVGPLAFGDPVLLLKRGREETLAWSPEEEKALCDLATAVGGHALAIDVMRAQIRRGVHPADLRQQLIGLSDELLDDDLSPALPTGHGASLVRTLQGSMIDLVERMPEARAVLLLLALTPPEPRVWEDLVQATLTALGSHRSAARVISELVRYGLLVHDDEAEAESDRFIQVHAITRMVARSLLQHAEPPLQTDPRTRRTVAVTAARWFAGRGGKLRSDDDFGAVHWFQRGLLLLEDYVSDPTIAERVLRAEPLRGIARAEIRAPTRGDPDGPTLDDPSWQHALDRAVQAQALIEEGLAEHPGNLDLLLARAQALALHGVVLDQRVDRLRRVGRLGEALAVNAQIISMVREQIDVRQQRAAEIEAQPVPTGHAEDQQTREQQIQQARVDAARAWINLPGLLIRRATIMRDLGRAGDWAEVEAHHRAVAALDEAEEVYRRILGRREQIFPPGTRTTGQSLEIAACAYGIAAVVYVRGALTPSPGTGNVADLMRIAGLLARSTRLRLAGNVADASKCLVLAAKVGLALRASLECTIEVPWDDWLAFADRVTPPAGEVLPGLPQADEFPTSLDELLTRTTSPAGDTREGCSASRDAAALAVLAALDHLSPTPQNSDSDDPQLLSVATTLARASLAWLALTEKLGAQRAQTTDHVMTDWAEEGPNWVPGFPTAP